MLLYGQPRATNHSILPLSGNITRVNHVRWNDQRQTFIQFTSTLQFFGGKRPYTFTVIANEHLDLRIGQPITCDIEGLHESFTPDGQFDQLRLLTLCVPA